MSMPSISGYMDKPTQDTLADLWQRPVGNYPSELWLEDDLRTVTANPAGWVQFFRRGNRGIDNG
jgi:hypothetical protein